MGAWGEHTFANDFACDWLDTFVAEPRFSAVRSAIDAVLEVKSPCIPSFLACKCLAACEVLARLQGRWGARTTYTAELDQWIEANPVVVTDDLKVAADSAIQRILGDHSELLLLWDDGGRNQAWHDAVDELRDRVRG